MDDNRFGWGRVFTVTGGTAYGHDGALYSNQNKEDGPQIGDLGLETFIVKLPANVELALSVNSVGEGWRFLHTIVEKSYNASRVEE